jgi:hypothetical protein
MICRGEVEQSCNELFEETGKIPINTNDDSQGKSQFGKQEYVSFTVAKKLPGCCLVQQLFIW